ncbi:hypothetical protein IMG5_062040 [Ichthyophthirius multifiliis]|uniref:Uncharacterized protein n=1 Tax=Ichthyophthirius multifiliis TaxID=5932 RepID=G0QNW7_ICHMU|nr:hypothetical protein IMG5_062040 [Ichthyophthirius multifiliis]EGR33082.1 hypothetical protein IMG5_062040 [Ichthyophthirius multifiliis]|eukprot:XP_004037068.1 hypothetical protein IMG5_062040 [Ichthyophthirius multifiliis]
MADKQDKRVRDKSPVAEMRTWNEVILKERSKQQIYMHFSINPRKIFLYSDKPNNNIFVQQQMKNSGTKNPFLDFTKLPEGMETNKSPELNQEILTKLSHIGQTPTQKYKFPQTSNQDLGWYNKYARSLSPQRNQNQFNYPKKTCNETEYANEYYNMLRISPFSNKVK